MAASKTGFDPDGNYLNGGSSGSSSVYSETPVSQQATFTAIDGGTAVIAGTGSTSATIASLQSQSLANASAINSIKTILTNFGITT